MDAIDQLCSALLQRLGGGDIGLDHHLFDQAVGVEHAAWGDGEHAAVVAEHDAPLRAFDLEGRALVARDLQSGVGGPQGLQHRLQQRRGDGVGRTVDGALRLFV